VNAVSIGEHAHRTKADGQYRNVDSPNDNGNTGYAAGPGLTQIWDRPELHVEQAASFYRGVVLVPHCGQRP